MCTVVVEPWLCNIEIDDSLAEIFQDKFHVFSVFGGKKLLISIDL